MTGHRASEIAPATARDSGDASPPRTIAEVLAEARERLHRLTPTEAELAVSRGAVLVDIRPSEQRREHGELDIAIPIERNVLEWRLDPSSGAALPFANHDLEVIVLCQEGYMSSLAAASLQDLGIHRATDVIGGYAAWRAGPVASASMNDITRAV